MSSATGRQRQRVEAMARDQLRAASIELSLPAAHFVFDTVVFVQHSNIDEAVAEDLLRQAQWNELQAVRMLRVHVSLSACGCLRGECANVPTRFHHHSAQRLRQANASGPARLLCRRPRRRRRQLRRRPHRLLQTSRAQCGARSGHGAHRACLPTMLCHCCTPIATTTTISMTIRIALAATASD